MIRTPVLAVLAFLAVAPSPPRPAESATAAASASYPSEPVGWSYGVESSHGGPANQFRFFRGDRLNSNMDLGASPEVQAIVASIEHARPGDELSFRLAREAGALACIGHAEAPGRASGTCTFDPDERFAGDLARRGIAPKDGDEMLVLNLVDAHLAALDGLTAQGYRFGDAGEFIAISALKIVPAYADELRAAGLKVSQLGDLIAVKALKIDARWLGEMERAGYPDLAVSQAIQMRALGVTPDYAQRMTRVLRAVGELE